MTDDETVAVVISKSALSVTEEDTSGETYTVKLSHLPSEQVTVTVTGQSGTDLSLDKTSLTFTTTTWNTAQTVTVTAGNDADGMDDAATLTHTAAGGEYEGATATLSVTVVDNDRAIVLNKTALSVEEGDTSGATYTVKLATQPSETVTVTVSGHAGTDLTLDKTSLTFTTTTWGTAQTVTVTAGQDTDGADDVVTLTHTAAGGNYAGETAELTVTVDDDETVSVVLSKTALSVTEQDASGSTYTVKLSHRPSEQVTVTITGQSGTDLTLDKTSLTFTTTTWNMAQTVTVTAGNDADGTDDAVTLTHTAAGGEYDGATATLPVTVVDNDRAIVLSKSALTVDEGDTSGATYTVKLATQPSETVTVTVTGQSGTDLTLDETSLTFTTTTWSIAQTVTVTAGQDNDGADDVVTLTHTAGGGNYAGETAELAVTVTDDETVAVVLSKTALSVTEQDTTGASYTVKLSHRPSENVTVTVTGQSGTDLTLDKTTVTFTTTTWNTTQTVTVTAGNDADGTDDSVTLTHTATGGEYQGATATLPVTVVDNDRGIVLTPGSLTVDEGDATGASYTVKLATQPSESVTVSVSGHAGTDLTLDKTTLTFTTTTWSIAQTVTVTAGQDTDGADDTVTLTHTAAGGNYAGETAELAVTVTDDETVSVVLSKTALSVTEQDASGSTYTVKLSHQPSESVTVTVSGHAGTDLTLDKTTVTFITTTWNTAQTVTVTAGNDADGTDDSVTLTHTAAGGEYASVTATLPVTVVDNDRGIVLSKSTLTVEEGDTTGASYTVKLGHPPRVSPSPSGHAERPHTGRDLPHLHHHHVEHRTVTVTAGQDNDGADDVVTLTHTAGGGNYAGETADVTVTDDETGGSEQDGAERHRAGHDGRKLHRQALSPTLRECHRDGDGAVRHRPDAGQDDGDLHHHHVEHDADRHCDGGQRRRRNRRLGHAHAHRYGRRVPGSNGYPARDGGRQRPGESSPPGTVDEGDATGASYTVKLATQPSESVTVSVTGQSGTDVTLDKANLTFTTTTWSIALTVTVTAGQDTDGADDTVTLTHTAAGGNYAGVTAELAVTVTDDETVSVVLSKTALSVTEQDASGSTYTVKLSHQPSESVTVTVSGHAGTDLTLDKTTLTFTTTTWNVAQTVTVTAGNDADGTDDAVTLTHTAAGGEYASVTATLSVTVVDNDRAIVLSKSALTVDEGDTSGASYTVKLATQPSETVTVAVTGHVRHRPHPGQDLPHLHHHHLEHRPDGDGDGRPGHRRVRRRGHPHPHRRRRQLRRRDGGAGGHRGRRRDGGGGPQQDGAERRRGGYDGRKLHRQALPPALRAGDGDDHRTVGE